MGVPLTITVKDHEVTLAEEFVSLGSLIHSSVQSGPWHLGCTSEVSFSMCTASRTSSYSPVGPSVLYLA